MSQTCHLSVYYTKNNITKQYKNNKLKIITPTLNDDFELTDGSSSVLDIHDYIEFIVKKLETLTKIPPVHAYINRINNRLMFKIKYGYKLELQTPSKQWNYLVVQKSKQTKQKMENKHQVLKYWKYF